MASVSHAWLSLLSSLISVKAISNSNKGKIKLSLLLCQIVVNSVMKVDFIFFSFHKPSQQVRKQRSGSDFI